MDASQLILSAYAAVVAMDTKDQLSLVAGALFGLGFVPYIWDIFKIGVRPEKTSWIIWFVLDIIALAGMMAKHTDNFQIWVATVGAGVILIIAFVKGDVMVWTKLEKRCLGLAAIAIAVWQLSGEANWGIGISGGTAIIGSLPTFESAIKDPEKQGKLGWTLFFVSCLFEVSALGFKPLTFANMTQPLVFLFVETVMMYLIFLRKPAFA